jgi:hypothetical protein
VTDKTFPFKVSPFCITTWSARNNSTDHHVKAAKNVINRMVFIMGHSNPWRFDLQICQLNWEPSPVGRLRSAFAVDITGP